MPHTRTITTRGIQLQLLTPPRSLQIEPKGVVYTKRWVVDLLLNLAGFTAEKNLVDAVAVEPAAGSGAFLQPMIERLIASCRGQKRPLSELKDSLIAYELDDSSAVQARQIAVSVLVGYGVDTKMANDLAESWVRTGDYLFDAGKIEADYVIGNPPYVRLEEIPEEMAAVYRKTYRTMCGRADLYVAFFEAALQQLKRGGVCAFICADRWMRNQYGAELRQLITSKYSVEVLIEMHQADAFHEEVDAYPAITVIRCKQQGMAVVACAGKRIESLGSDTISGALFATISCVPTVLPRGLRAARIGKWFEGADPWPCNSPEQLLLLRRLEDQFPALECNAKIGIGVATGNDDVFITKDSNLVEKQRLLKLALAQDIRGGQVQWSGHYLVDPWDCNGLVDLNKYPRLRTFFEAHAEALRKRHTALKNARGWYRTIDRVSHSLTAKPKLYIADIKDILSPVLDYGETYPHHNLYFIQSDEWDLEILGGLLLSAVGQFFVESYGVRMRGGYLRFQAQYLRRIRVPNPKWLTSDQSIRLKDAFHAGDRQSATQVALEVYGVEEKEMERALGH